MPKEVRMADIAERVGVSTVTVSKALADKDGVSEEMREKIKKTARQMGYRLGSSENRFIKRTGNVGILVPLGFVERGRSFYWKMYENLTRQLTNAGYLGILEMIDREAEDKLVMPRTLRDEKIDGLILIGQENSDYRGMLRKNPKIPVVFLDSYSISDGHDSIISDGYYGMAVITNHLLQLGHTDIRFVGTLNVTSSIDDRYYGYCRAMMDHGINVEPDMVVPDRTRDGVLNVTLPETLPTAFACNCDMVACELMAKLRDSGVRVPEDVSVAGFDDYVIPGLGMTEITTYSVDTETMAKACVDCLIKKIKNRHYSSGLNIITGRLIVRGTTAAIPPRPNGSADDPAAEI